MPAELIVRLLTAREEPRNQITLPKVCHNLFLPDQIEREVYGNPIEPRKERRIVPEVAKPEIRLDKSFLCDIVRFVVVADKPTCDPVDSLLVASH